jgi:hypothetical protein
MHYRDTRGTAEAIAADKTGEETYREATLTFMNERSHRAAAGIVEALGQQHGILRAMQKQLEEPRQIIDPMSLPKGAPLELGMDPRYNARRYTAEAARQIRRSIGDVAIYHEIPEMRPSSISAEVASDAYALNATTLGVNEPLESTVYGTVVRPAARPLPPTVAEAGMEHTISRERPKD